MKKEIFYIIEQFETGNIDAEKCIKKIKANLIEAEEEEVLDYAFPFHKQTKKDLNNIKL
tara:strand:+ start:197 stop:373 length:177 start_codon:yes stop_codon:yes gene_type:complete